MFAAGEIMAGNVLGQGYAAGMGMTIGSVFGRIAGREAARNASQLRPNRRTPNHASSGSRRGRPPDDGLQFLPLLRGRCARCFRRWRCAATFADGDLNYLANLCHSCGACYIDCQFSPPHEFDVNVPRRLAEVRNQSYRPLRPAARPCAGSSSATACAIGLRSRR